MPTQVSTMLCLKVQGFLQALELSLFILLGYYPKIIYKVPIMSLTHFNSQGDAHMVDVSSKAHTHRRAVAKGTVTMSSSTFEMILNGNAKKGDVLGIARIAGIQASKRTSDLIPLCHPIALTHVSVSFETKPQSSQITCTATAETTGPTGVEMEALTAVQVALLTIYDMCKAVDRGMRMDNIHLAEKLGGKSGHFVAVSA